jgi:hypothetical protein
MLKRIHRLQLLGREGQQEEIFAYRKRKLEEKHEMPAVFG